MLDKSKIYVGFHAGPGRHGLAKKFKRVKILFEDDISFYVESLTANDGKGLGIRYSAKKNWYFFKEILPKPLVHNYNLALCPIEDGLTSCPFCDAGIPATCYLGRVCTFTVVNRADDTVAVWKSYVSAALVILEGVVVKNRYGPVGREADKGDYERADLIVKNGCVVTN